ncbi:MAG: tRNA lysidine(34) synthetase TilS [Patescibacteria group bacterium]
MHPLPSNSKLLLALSGGPDSVYLLYQLLEIKEKKNIQLHLAHLNHNVRHQQSDQDEKFVTTLAQKLNLPLSKKKLTKRATGQNPSEQKLRQLRYNFLEKIRAQTNCAYILTAHHLDDQIETIIFNFIRGTGPTGLTGMHFQQRKILRPILDISKTEILAYLSHHHLKYRTDRTNQDIKYSRNYIRQELIPAMQKLNPHLSQSISQLSQIIANQQNYINQETLKSLNKITVDCEGTGTLRRARTILSLTKYKKLHPTLQTEIIKTIITPLVPPGKQLTHKIITEVQNILLHSQGGSQKILFDKLSIRKKNDKIYLRLI